MEAQSITVNLGFPDSPSLYGFQNTGKGLDGSYLYTNPTVRAAAIFPIPRNPEVAELLIAQWATENTSDELKPGYYEFHDVVNRSLLSYFLSAFLRKRDEKAYVVFLVKKDSKEETERINHEDSARNL